MKTNHEFKQYVVELLEVLGPIQSRAMFGGFGIYLCHSAQDKTFFALIADNCLYLKADKQNQQTYIDEGLARFSYLRQDKVNYLNYYQAPECIFEDSDELTHWCNLALDAALRAK
jgi:DNA transformation protein and related proteins